MPMQKSLQGWPPDFWSGDVGEGALKIDELNERSIFVHRANPAGRATEEEKEEVWHRYFFTQRLCEFDLSWAQLLHFIFIVEEACIVVVDGEHVQLDVVKHEDEVNISLGPLVEEIAMIVHNNHECAEAEGKDRTSCIVPR